MKSGSEYLTFPVVIFISIFLFFRLLAIRPRGMQHVCDKWCTDVYLLNPASMYNICWTLPCHKLSSCSTKQVKRCCPHKNSSCLDTVLCDHKPYHNTRVHGSKKCFKQWAVCTYQWRIYYLWINWCIFHSTIHNGDNIWIDSKSFTKAGLHVCTR